MSECENPEDVCLVLDETMRAFDRFRGTDTLWGNLRNKYLKPAIEVLLSLNGVITETAVYFVRYCRS